MQVTYDSLLRAIGRATGYGRTSTAWTSDQLADVEDIITSGLRRFYFPPPMEGKSFTWSFLSRTENVTLVVGKNVYAMPSDLLALSAPPIIDTIGKIDVANSDDLAAIIAKAPLTGTPRYCAMQPASVSNMQGTKYEMLVYPTPSAAGTMSVQYLIDPPAISTYHQYPLGGAMHGETILESCLAAAEEILDESEGVHAKRFAECMAVSMAQDMGGAR